MKEREREPTSATPNGRCASTGSLTILSFATGTCLLSLCGCGSLEFTGDAAAYDEALDEAVIGEVEIDVPDIAEITDPTADHDLTDDSSDQDREEEEFICADLEYDCFNGIDDDCDGDRDCDDCECVSMEGRCCCVDPPETIDCNNGLDDDMDLLSDCEDPHCLVSSFCGGVPCPEVTLGSMFPVSFSGDSEESSNDETGSCGGYGGFDISHEWTAPFAGAFTIDTFGSSFNTVLYVRVDGCTGTELACNDNSWGSGFSQVTVDLDDGQPVIIIVDVACWVNGGGDYFLNIH